MSITALKRKVKEAREAYDEARTAWENDPKVIKLRKALKKAERTAQKKNLPERDKAQKAVVISEKALRDFQEVSVVSIPDHIDDIVRRCMSGVDYGPKGLVVEWISLNERFAIIVQPGHAYWSNQMDGQKYATAERTLLDALLDDPDETGMNLFRTVMVKTHEGRFTKAVKDEWLAYVSEEKT